LARSPVAWTVELEAPRGRAIGKDEFEKRGFPAPPTKTAAGKRGAAAPLFEAHFSVASHARGHNLEFGAPVKRRLVQGVGTTSSGRARAAQNGRAAALVQHFVFILFIFIEHAHGVVESDRSKGNNSKEATSDVPIAVLDVNDTRPSDLLRGRRVL
jgi:hypothetical protein